MVMDTGGNRMLGTLDYGRVPLCTDTSRWAHRTETRMHGDSWARVLNIGSKVAAPIQPRLVHKKTVGSRLLDEVELLPTSQLQPQRLRSWPSTYSLSATH